MSSSLIHCLPLAIVVVVAACAGTPLERPDADTVDAAGSVLPDAPTARADARETALDAFAARPEGDSGRPPRDVGPLPDGELPPRRDVGPRDGGRGVADGGARADAPATGMVDPTVMVSVVIHLEGMTLGERTVRDRYATFLRSYADAFEARGGRMTVETSAFSEAIFDEGGGTDHVLMELEGRGHDIGVHADVGGVIRPGFTQETFVAELTSMREHQIAIGLHPTHVSGICSSLDWVDAAIRGGFPFATSTVDYCLKSLPIELQPADVAACTSPASCHHAYPHEIPESLHLHRARSGADWITDSPDGALVLVPSAGSLGCFAESAADPGFGGSMCTLDSADTAAHLADLDAAIAAADPARINSHEIVWSLGQPMADATLATWLDGIAERVARGEARWATAAEVVAAYEASE